MRKILLAGVAALGLAGSASAADLAVAPAPLPVPIFTWTGCYLGINGGWIGARDEYSHHSFVRVNLNSIVIPPTTFDPISYSSDESGGTFGGQFGCQYQWGAVVLGGEWDLNWSGLKEDNYSRYFSPFWNENSVPYVGYSELWSHKQVDWFSTARVRLAWAAWDRFLIYATGGVALANYDAYTHANENPRFSTPDYFGAYRENRIGWTVGGGFEWAFAANWTAKAEFLYLDFGSFDYISPFVGGGFGPNIIDYRYTSIDAKEYVARVGINYLFHLGPPALAGY